MHFAYWGKSAVMKPGHSYRYTVALAPVAPDLTSALMCVACILPLFLVKPLALSLSLFFLFLPFVNRQRLQRLFSFLPREHLLCDVYIIGLLLHHLHIQHETVAIMDMDIDSHGCYGNGPTRAMGDSRGFRA